MSHSSKPGPSQKSPGRYLLKKSMRRAGFPLPGHLKEYIDRKMVDPAIDRLAESVPPSSLPNPQEARAEEEPIRPKRVNRTVIDPALQAQEPIVDPAPPSSSTVLIVPYESLFQGEHRISPENETDVGRILDDQAEVMDTLKKRYPGIFTITSRFLIGDKTVAVGSAMRLSQDITIPVFITGPDKANRLMLAYRSESHSVWRRFAGILGNYHKGGNQHFQTLHHRLQHALDKSASFGAIEVRDQEGGIARLSRLGFTPNRYEREETRLQYCALGLVAKIEDDIQNPMLSSAVEFRSDPPERLTEYWWSGSEDDVYGRHFKVLLVSQNRDFLYCLAVTPDGIFVPFIESRNAPGINAGGSPLIGLNIPDSPPEIAHILNPIVDYFMEVHRDRLVRREGVRVNGTVVGARGGRARVEGLIESPGSPLRTVAFALSDIPRLLRQGYYDGARARLDSIMDGNSPLHAESPSPRPGHTELLPYEQSKMSTLLHAYGLHSAGGLTEEKATELGISRRELALIRRYHEHYGPMDDSSDSDHGSIYILDRLRRCADQWASDEVLSLNSSRTIVGRRIPT